MILSQESICSHIQTQENFLQTFVQEFEQDNKIRGLAPRSIANYNNEIRPFVQWLIDTHKLTDVTSVTPQHVKAYLLFIKERHFQRTGRQLAPASSHIAFRSIKRFCNFLLESEYIDKSFVRKIAAPKLNDEVKDIFTDEEITRLFKACENSRDKALIACLLSSGCRRSEIISWQYKDIDLTTGTVFCRQTKTDVPRTVYIDPLARKYLLQYMREFKITEKSLHFWVSFSKPNHPLTSSGLTQLFRKIGRAAVICPQELVQLE